MHRRTLQRFFPTAKFDEPLRRYTAWKIGGPADALLEPLGVDELIEAAETAREHDVPVTILGGGTNVLVLDGGIRGLTIRLARALTDVTITGTSVVADAGVLYPVLANMTAADVWTYITEHQVPYNPLQLVSAVKDLLGASAFLRSRSARRP